MILIMFSTKHKRFPVNFTINNVYNCLFHVGNTILYIVY